MKAGLLIIIMILCILLGMHNIVLASGAICLYDSTNIYINNDLNSTINVFRTFQITNESGQKYADISIPINDYIRVGKIKGYALQKNGDKINLTKKDIQSQSTAGTQGAGISKTVTFSIRSANIGAIIHYEYELKIKSLLYLPRITRGSAYPTDRFVVRIENDKKTNIKYDYAGLTLLREDHAISLFAENLSERADEPYSCPDNVFLLISSDAFTYNGMKYPSRSWPEAGRFFAQLALQAEKPFDEIKSLADRLVANSENRMDSLNAIFSFMSDSITYVALQIGRGDFHPQPCASVINKRLGDCKDQSTLLSALYRAVGVDAYPALVSTDDFPQVGNLNPWPGWFNHAITAIKTDDGDLLLDPGDPRMALSTISPALRNKYYLVCDGISQLKKASAGPIPEFGIEWQFNISFDSSDSIMANFTIRYTNDAEFYYNKIIRGNSDEKIKQMVESSLKNAGWEVLDLKLEPIKYFQDELGITGAFITFNNPEKAASNFNLASPLVNYLLADIFSSARKNDYCRPGTIRFLEIINVELSSDEVTANPSYNDSWEKDEFQFADEMIESQNLDIYQREFNFNGGIITLDDYNSFRDVLIAKKNQRYVILKK